MSYTQKNKGLDKALTRRCVGSDAVRRVACIAWVAGAMVTMGCAALPPITASSIDTVAQDHSEDTLAARQGRVVLVDLCTSWVAACNVNARVLDEVLLAYAGRPVDAVTLLLDERNIADAALASYGTTLGLKHDVVLAGPRVRAGSSSLKDTGYVPRFVVLDAEGRIRVDAAGGVLGVEGVVELVRPLVEDAERAQRQSSAR